MDVVAGSPLLKYTHVGRHAVCFCSSIVSLPSSTCVGGLEAHLLGIGNDRQRWHGIHPDIGCVPDMTFQECIKSIVACLYMA